METPLGKTVKRWRKASEFARLTGVTVRTLHHYDRLGLLKPGGHTAAGYRLYGERDFARLQQIAILKFIGFPLNQIKEILDRDSLPLTAALRLQRKILAEKRRQLDFAIVAIEKVESALASGSEPDWESFANIIEVINMENNMEWMKKYYTEEQLQSLAARWSPELQEKASRDWAQLIKEVEAALGEDPASEKVQALAARWTGLIAAFTGGDPGIEQSLRNLYADQTNWPSTFERPCGSEVGIFIGQAMAISRKKEGL
ncbi:MAG: MerR family transcriptional regulator [Blastocatellia bacterium]